MSFSKAASVKALPIRLHPHCEICFSQEIVSQQRRAKNHEFLRCKRWTEPKDPCSRGEPQRAQGGALSAVPSRMRSAATSSAATESTTATARPTPRVSRSTRTRSGSGGGPGRNLARHTEHRDARSAQQCSLIAQEGCAQGMTAGNSPEQQ